MARLLVGLVALGGNHPLQQRFRRRSPRPLFPVVKLIIRVDGIGDFRLLQLAGHKGGKCQLRRRRRGFKRLAHRPAPHPTTVAGLLLPAQRGGDTGADGGFFRRCAGGPGVFTVGLKRPPGEDVPLRQNVILAVWRQLQAGEIFRRGAKARGDKNHPLRIDTVDGFNGFFVDAI